MTPEMQDASPHLMVSTVVPPSGVRFMERGRFRFPGTRDLLLGRVSALELVTETDDHDLQTICEQPLFCVMHDMQILDRSSEEVRHSANRRHSILIK